MSECPKCHTTYTEVMQTGFVGCEHCYTLLPELEKAVASLYGNKPYCGKKAVKHDKV